MLAAFGVFFTRAMKSRRRGASGSTTATTCSEVSARIISRMRKPQPMSATRIFAPFAICRARACPKPAHPMLNSGTPAAASFRKSLLLVFTVQPLSQI